MAVGIEAKKNNERISVEVIRENLMLSVLGDDKMEIWGFLSAIKRRYLENRKGHPWVAFSVLCRFLLVNQFKVYATVFGFTGFSFVVSQRQFLAITDGGHARLRYTTSRKVTLH